MLYLECKCEIWCWWETCDVWWRRFNEDSVEKQFPKGNPQFQFESESEVAQSRLTLCDPMDSSLPGSSVHGIFQARVLEWVAISFSKGSSWPRDRTQVSRIVDRRFAVWATRELHESSSICPLKRMTEAHTVWCPTYTLAWWECVLFSPDSEETVSSCTWSGCEVYKVYFSGGIETFPSHLTFSWWAFACDYN